MKGRKAKRAGKERRPVTRQDRLGRLKEFHELGVRKRSPSGIVEIAIAQTRRDILYSAMLLTGVERL
jgi:hypothetical protein